MDQRLNCQNLLFIPLVALILTGCTLNLLNQPPEPNALILKIASDQGWQYSQASIKEGETFSIEVGTVEWGDQNTTITDGLGLDYVCGDPTCCEPMPNVQYGALIGRVGDQDFLVGNGGTFTLKSSGLLAFRVNDCDAGLHDNSGEMIVVILTYEE